MHAIIWILLILVVFVGELGHAQRRMDGLSSVNVRCTARTREGPATTETIPLDWFVFVYGCHVFLAHTLYFFSLPFLSACGNCSENSALATDRVGTRLIFWFFLFGNSANLI